MAVYFNGKEIKEIYYNGKKINEAYFNGKKVHKLWYYCYKAIAVDGTPTEENFYLYAITLLLRNLKLLVTNERCRVCDESGKLIIFFIT